MYQGSPVKTASLDLRLNCLKSLKESGSVHVACLGLSLAHANSQALQIKSCGKQQLAHAQSAAGISCPVYQSRQSYCVLAMFNLVVWTQPLCLSELYKSKHIALSFLVWFVSWGMQGQIYCEAFVCVEWFAVTGDTLTVPQTQIIFLNCQHTFIYQIHNLVAQ